MSETATCELCGEPMPAGEEMFKLHGYSGPCPKPPMPRPALPTVQDLMQERGEAHNVLDILNVPRVTPDSDGRAENKLNLLGRLRLLQARIEGHPESWRLMCMVGWMHADPMPREFWVRFTGKDALFYWLHPVENRWVGEPEQKEMPTFATAELAQKAIRTAPPPPSL